MITLLKSGFEEILRLFYQEKEDSLHFREIVRKTKLHEPRAHKILQDLEKEGILISRREANLKKYEIQKNSKTFSYFQIFDLERFEKLPQRRKHAIQYYLRNLEEQPICIVLFGSTAKETFKETSDIDLLLITNRKIKTEHGEKEADALTGLKISTFQITYQKYKEEMKIKKDKVIQSATYSGYPICNHLAFYGMKYE